MNLLSNTLSRILTTTKFHATWTCTCVIDYCFQNAIYYGGTSPSAAQSVVVYVRNNVLFVQSIYKIDFFVGLEKWNELLTDLFGNTPKRIIKSETKNLTD